MPTLLKFLEDLNASQDLRPETRRVYASIIRTHIARSELADMELDHIQPAGLRAFFGAMLQAGVGPGAIGMTRRLINKAFTTALSDGILDRNPVRSVRLPRHSRNRQDPPTSEEVVAIADAIAKRYRALVYVLAWTGLRIGEAGGLTVDAWDAERRRIVVRQQSTPYGMADLKTDAAHRAVAVPKFVAAALQRHVELFPPIDGRLFSTQAGKAVTARTFHPTFVRACRRAGLRDFHPHELRHHAVSAMARSGAPIKAVQVAVGHTSAKLTLEVYSHVTDQDLQDIADRLDQAEGVA